MLSRLSRNFVYSNFATKVYVPVIQQTRFVTDEEIRQCTYVMKHEYNEEEVPADAPLAKLEATEVDTPVPRTRTLAIYGPQRDHVNFPRLELPEHSALTRLVTIPETWFKFVEPRLGVSGLYSLGIGLYLFLVQKEILITGDPHWTQLMAWSFWVYVITRSKLGEIGHNFLKNSYEEYNNEWRKFERKCVEYREEAIKHEKLIQSQIVGGNTLFEAKKENINLQREAIYRETAMDIYQKVKRQLDYLVEVSKIDERVKQQFMVNWVIQQVQESISKTSEKDTLKQCIKDLNALAARV